MNRLRNNSCTAHHQQGIVELESQRDSVTKPRVARSELPWEEPSNGPSPEGVASTDHDRIGRNYVVVEKFLATQPRVGFANPGLGDGIPLGFSELVAPSSDQSSNCSSETFSKL